MSKDNPDKKKKPVSWNRPNMSQLEADVAYFDARICMIEAKNSSCYHAAELKAYQTLVTALRGTLDRMNAQRERIKKRRVDAQKKKEGKYEGEYLVEELDPTSIVAEEVIDMIPVIEAEEDKVLDDKIIQTLPE